MENILNRSYSFLSVTWSATTPSPCRRHGERSSWWSVWHVRLSRSSVWQLSSSRCACRRRWSGKTACSESSSTSSAERGTSRRLWRGRRWARMNKEDEWPSLLSLCISGCRLWSKCQKEGGFYKDKGRQREMLGAQIHGTNHINNSVFIMKSIQWSQLYLDGCFNWEDRYLNKCLAKDNSHSPSWFQC